MIIFLLLTSEDWVTITLVLCDAGNGTQDFMHASHDSLKLSVMGISKLRVLRHPHQKNPLYFQLFLKQGRCSSPLPDSREVHINLALP